MTHDLTESEIALLAQTNHPHSLAAEQASRDMHGVEPFVVARNPGQLPEYRTYSKAPLVAQTSYFAART